MFHFILDNMDQIFLPYLIHCNISLLRYELLFSIANFKIQRSEYVNSPGVRKWWLGGELKKELFTVGGDLGPLELKRS